MGASSSNDSAHESLFYKLANGKVRKDFKKALGSKIRIGRHDYKILICSELVSGGELCSGLVDLREKVIYVRHGTGEEMVTFIHEVAHAEIHESALNARSGWCLETEEQIVEIWGQSTASFLEHLLRLSAREEN
jgi:hypothetical protein